MKKASINKLTRRFGFELHGTGFIQSMVKPSFKEDAFKKQGELLSNHAATIFDVGANVGDITLQYSDLFPKSQVYAFEPFSENFEKLSSRVAHLNRVFPFQLALGEQVALMPFYVNNNGDTNSLLQPRKMGLSSDKQVENKSVISVTVETLDLFCAKHQLPEIDILKMDIQGGELAALKGAVGLLSTQSIKLIYIETYFRQQYMHQPLFAEIAAWLQQYNYFVQDLYNPIYGKGSIAWCDTIFLPASF